MFCPKCGKINPDNAEKCSGCDAVLKEETAIVPEKKSGKALKTTIAVVLVILIIIALVLLFCSCGSQEPPKELMTY